MKTIFNLHLLLLTSLVSFSQETAKQAILTSDAPQPIGPYSQAILAGNTLYVSGQIAINPNSGILDTSNFEKETIQVMENIGKVLEAAGMGFVNVVKATIYTTDLKQFKLINEVYGKYFSDNPPARETVQVAALPKGARVEISVVAVK